MTEHPWVTVGTAFGIGLVLGAKPRWRRTLLSLAARSLKSTPRPR